MFSSNCGLNLVKEKWCNALLQDFVSHLNVEVPSPLASLPETNLSVPLVPVHVSRHRKPWISGPVDLH